MIRIYFTRLLKLTVVAFCLVPTACAQADIVFIDYNVSTGPHWTGTVDTIADTLTITSWAEQSGGSQGWTPITTPLPVWSAVNSSGNPYDVSDSFDGTISGSWGFISPVSVTAMSWNEGSPQSTFSSYFTGWGARRSGAGGLSVAPNETEFGWVPIDFGSQVQRYTGSVSVVPEPSAFVFWSLFSIVAVWKRTRRHDSANHS